ncbi:MAG TPA: DUF2911 domain-containing protein [Chryseosolibacter sp.]|nr:DUF2911 domain-containing protein [Chryseosolibacter sp.]
MRSKKFWIFLAILAVILIAVFFYLNFRSRGLSPLDEESLTSGGVTVTVEYSRPSARGRLIFGPEDQEALQPFGKYWRLGANEATEITFNRDVLFNGSPVKAGSYSMYAIPGPNSFEIVLNTEIDRSGSNPPKEENDALRTKVQTQSASSPVEQFTISLAPQGEGMAMVFEWSDTRFVVPIRAAE